MKIQDLTFVASRDGKQLPKPVGDQLPRCFWHVQSSGDYHQDTTTGEKLALEYLAYEEANIGGCSILGQIVKDMGRPLTGIEVGFLEMVGFAAGAGAHRARRVSAYWDRCRAGLQQEGGSQ